MENEGFDWRRYRREQGEGRKKIKDLNAASVSRIARKIMAREWAMALGHGPGFLKERRVKPNRRVKKARP